MILSEKIKIKMNSGLANYYNSIGYDIDKTQEYFEIFVKDLQISSTIKVTKRCDICIKDVKDLQYSAIIKQRKNNNGLDVCKSCKNKMNSLTSVEEESLFFANKKLCEEFVEFEDFEMNKYSLKQIKPLSNQKAKWECSACGHKFLAKISDRYGKSSRCPSCSGRVPNDKNRLTTVRPDIAKEWNYSKNDDLPENYTYSSHKKVWWVCKDSHEYLSQIDGRTNMGAGCPYCAASIGEKKIRKTLSNKNINFQEQKEFDNLLGLKGRKLSYDFYLPEYNLLIEYQGHFHDGKMNEYVAKNLNVQREHDERKRAYALNNGYKLLEIWYYDINNIDNILKRELN